MRLASATGTVAASDVPCASRRSIESIVSSAGTMTMPPPIPNRPLSSPAPAPMTRPCHGTIDEAVRGVLVTAVVTGVTLAIPDWSEAVLDPASPRPSGETLRP